MKAVPLFALYVFGTVVAFASMKREVSNYKGEGDIRYMSHTFFPFFTNRGFMLELPKFDLSKPQERIYSLKGIPTSQPIHVWLALSPAESDNVRENGASITIRILAANGSIVYAQENRLRDMGFTNHGMPGARWEAYFKPIETVNLKKAESYRLELIYQPDVANFPTGEGNVTLEVSITP
jgi:hypothetical protein